MPTVVLPVLDEVNALAALLGALPGGYDALVVDNGSTDGSGRVALEGGAELISEARRGFGAACWAGLLAARPLDGVVCFMDGDGSFDPAELPRVTDPVLAGRADLVLGRRRPSESGAWPIHARLANRGLSAVLALRCGLRLQDLGPMRAGRRDELVALGLRDRRSGWPLEMVMAAAAREWRIREVDVSYHPRVGRSKVTGTVRGTARAVSDMGRLVVTGAGRSSG